MFEINEKIKLSISNISINSKNNSKMQFGCGYGCSGTGSQVNSGDNCSYGCSGTGTLGRGQGCNYGCSGGGGQ